MIGTASLGKKGGETTDRLLLHCDIARDLWNLVLMMFGVEWVCGGALDVLEKKV
jgi:hypothetical protein